VCFDFAFVCTEAVLGAITKSLNNMREELLVHT
jgi:hypothetical protein